MPGPTRQVRRRLRHAQADFLHRASTRLVRAADLIVIEDLNVSGMVRNRHPARAISDCGWGEFRRQLAYKCQRPITAKYADFIESLYAPAGKPA